MLYSCSTAYSQLMGRSILSWRNYTSASITAGQIVIMDNLAAHKGKKVEQLIQSKGCQLLFLPAYSPDFSPIEETFSKLKTYLRRAGARTREALQEAICQRSEEHTSELQSRSDLVCR